MIPRHVGVRPGALAALLAVVGRLTVDQAARYQSATATRATRELEAAVQEGAAVKFQGAYWHPACPRRQARHRELTADAYLAILAWPDPVAVVPNPPGPAEPDLTLRIGANGRVMALEADTGTESGRQWREKAARYSGGDQGFDVVVAVTTSAKRAQHILAWWRTEPLAPPAVAWALADFPKTPPEWPGAALVAESRPGLPLSPTAADWARWGDHRPWFHAIDGTLYLPSVGDRLVRQLHLLPLGHERRQGFDIRYWARLRRATLMTTSRADPPMGLTTAWGPRCNWSLFVSAWRLRTVGSLGFSRWCGPRPNQFALPAAATVSHATNRLTGARSPGASSTDRGWWSTPSGGPTAPRWDASIPWNRSG